MHIPYACPRRAVLVFLTTALVFCAFSSTFVRAEDEPTISVAAMGGGAAGGGMASGDKMRLGGQGNLTLRIPTGENPDDYNVVVSGGGGYYYNTVLGGASLGFAPKGSKGSWGWMGSISGECSLVTCSGGAYGGVRVPTSANGHIDLQARVPMLPGIINRDTSDFSVPLAGLRVGLDEKIAPLAHLFLDFEGDVTKGTNPSEIATSGQAGVGFLGTARLGMRFELSKHFSALWQMVLQDQVSKHVEIDQTSGARSVDRVQNSFGEATTAGVEYAY